MSLIRIEHCAPRLFAGVSQRMSFAGDRTATLWQSFMPRRLQVAQRKSDKLYSLQVYEHGMEHFSNPFLEFTKYALVETEVEVELPAGLQYFRLPPGLYVVIEHTGGRSGAEALFRKIFTEMLPEAGYAPDDRPFFEELEADYLSRCELAKESIWIPIRKVEQNQSL